MDDWGHTGGTLDRLLKWLLIVAVVAAFTVGFLLGHFGCARACEVVSSIGEL